MKENSTSVKALLPVLFGFFIMGFCDVVGISTSYVKSDFGLSETIAGFLPSMVFLWFLLLAVPAAMFMNWFGRKKTVLASMLVTLVGMIIPFVHYDLYTCLLAFALLGIGNTILQVSLNPLLTNVVKGNVLASSLTAGQVLKAVSSFCGPFIAAFAATMLGNWQYLFPVFALLTLLSMCWLLFVPIPEETSGQLTSSWGATFCLLKDRTILLLFLGIVFVVGVDVVVNTVPAGDLKSVQPWSFPRPSSFASSAGWKGPAASLQKLSPPSGSFPDKSAPFVTWQKKETDWLPVR